ncbi:probable protein phosphatase 2C T23F11.1 [Nilaparvata lugens]|uniref:probable protein phosphatase 2C T23F11.1 n=1 Tax=Nilaparvata lugens TaxID=108931 RepID=UPI00193CA891|nr:probable protein phosphatase 2C T23F11.1 [Nilaparvata lugens]
MGQTLGEPVTAKKSSCCQNCDYKVGSSCMQGWRINMEDSHTHILSCPDDPQCAYFGVFDGHGGSTIAQYAGTNLHKYIMDRPEYREGNMEEALKQGFLDLDAAMRQDDLLKDLMAGSTAICVLIKNNTLYCANVGDSRAVASVRGETVALSYDHKPNNEDELRRITAAGGWVEYNRVKGNLALSRALGDFVFKKNKQKRPEEQIVSALPDVKIHTLTPDWEFVVIACDGIWDVMCNEEVTQFVRMRIAHGMEPEDICEELMTRCLAPDGQMGGLGCDNMTVVIVCLLHGQPYAKLATKCQLKPPNTSGPNLLDPNLLDPNRFPDL